MPQFYDFLIHLFLIDELKTYNNRQHHRNPNAFLKHSAFRYYLDWGWTEEGSWVGSQLQQNKERLKGAMDSRGIKQNSKIVESYLGWLKQFHYRPPPFLRDTTHKPYTSSPTHQALSQPRKNIMVTTLSSGNGYVLTNMTEEVTNWMEAPVSFY